MIEDIINNIISGQSYAFKEVNIDINLMRQLNLRNIDGNCSYLQLTQFAISYLVRRYSLPGLTL